MQLLRLVLATEEFEIGRIPLVGFPLLLDSGGELVEPAFSFFVDRLLETGGVQSTNSWPTYGYALLHYFRFLEKTGRVWDERQVTGGADKSPESATAVLVQVRPISSKSRTCNAQGFSAGCGAKRRW
ncbi:hypothetical protein [Lysobacter antibioticus]|uniref:hypothetical protein n=1 Tax=Lysobacter antibioticus TaxID=84531 RepID=UPI0011E0058D|nr:hypothetical protein [Lysobacter antibioticus]